MGRYLIIGASSDIGQQVCHELRIQGHEVLTTARNTQVIQPNFVLDATVFADVEYVFQQTGQLDGVVNCAGSLLLKPAHLTSESEYLDVIAASLTTAFAVVRAAGAHMKRGGSVVLIGSAAAEIGLANHEAIAAAKAGIIGLMRSAAATYASQGLRFNVVEPGLTETRLTTALTQQEAIRKGSIAMHPLGRLGTAEDIARMIVFLLSSENNWITGQQIAVDGGLSTLKARPKV
jgi:3-oxoacyl-[acyl-carrier protein] reductase